MSLRVLAISRRNPLNPKRFSTRASGRGFASPALGARRQPRDFGAVEIRSGVGSMGAPSARKAVGALHFSSICLICASRGESFTDSSTVSFPTLLSACAIHTGTTEALSYCCYVLPDRKRKRSMEPRQLRLPGFTRLWGPAPVPLRRQGPSQAPSGAFKQRWI